LKLLYMRIFWAALAVLALLRPQAVLATVQFPDNIYLDGQKHFLFSTPLEQFLMGLWPTRKA